MQKIYIFGRGEYFKNKCETFKNKYEICGFIDNAVKIGERDSFLELPVYNPTQISQLPEYDIYCVSADFIAMWFQLRQLGVKEDRIKFGAMVPPLQSGVEEIAFSNGESIFSKDNYILYITSNGEQKKMFSQEDLKKIIRENIKKENENVAYIRKLSVYPVSKVFGSERGKAVDRYYIEKFLQDNVSDVKGIVLEIANNQYTRKYGGDKVCKSVVSHVKGWGNTILCNFETGEGVVEEAVDCIICTQTLQYIFDLSSAIKNIYKMLKKGGVALITVPGIKPLCTYDNDKWGEHWSFTSNSMEKLCSLVCESDSYEVQQYGNVKVATAYLYGVCVEEIDKKDLEYLDMQYPFLICAKICKR